MPKVPKVSKVPKVPIKCAGNVDECKLLPNGAAVAVIFQSRLDRQRRLAAEPWCHQREGDVSNRGPRRYQMEEQVWNKGIRRYQTEEEESTLTSQPHRTGSGSHVQQVGTANPKP